MFKENWILLFWNAYFAGEVSSSDDGAVSDSDQEEQFNDGYDENLIGDEEDRLRLEQMTEKEREQELYNRIERRQALKTRSGVVNIPYIGVC